MFVTTGVMQQTPWHGQSKRGTRKEKRMCKNLPFLHSTYADTIYRGNSVHNSKIAKDTEFFFSATPNNLCTYLVMPDIQSHYFMMPMAFEMFMVEMKHFSCFATSCSTKGIIHGKLLDKRGYRKV